MSAPSSPPSDLAEAHALLVAERAARIAAEAEAVSAKAERDAAQADAANEQAKRSANEALIAHLKLEIEKLKRALYGTRSERKARLLDQLELQLEELEAAASEDESAAAAAAEKTRTARAFQRKRPARKPFPDDIARERIVIEAPKTCPCRAGARLAKLGEDVTETLEAIPRRYKVIETVREKFAWPATRETIAQPPAPFHATARGFLGPSLLAMIVHDKFGQHIPLNRQSARFKAEGIDLSVSTLADQVGAASFALMPLYRLIEAYVLSAERLHGDDTTIPILAKGKTVTGRIWAYVRDDAPFGGPHAEGTGPPAALYYASRDRRGEHPEKHLAAFAGILQADAYSGFNALYDAQREPAPATPALCWAHARRKFFELAVRQEKSAPLIAGLEEWLRESRAGLSRSSAVAGPIDYMLKRWAGFARFTGDGRICLTDNAAERALRGLALGRKAWLFAGSDRGAERAAIMNTPIQTAKLNGVDPQAWLADVFARIAAHPQNRLAELLPWQWKRRRDEAAAIANAARSNTLSTAPRLPAHVPFPRCSADGYGEASQAEFACRGATSMSGLRCV